VLPNHADGDSEDEVMIDEDEALEELEEDMGDKDLYE
jgi:predicted RNase H-like HicB family nuclease